MKSKAVICTLFLCKLGAGKGGLPSLLGGKQRHSPVNTTFKCFLKGWYSLGLALSGAGITLTHPCVFPFLLPEGLRSPGS